MKTGLRSVPGPRAELEGRAKGEVRRWPHSPSQDKVSGTAGLQRTKGCVLNPSPCFFSGESFVLIQGSGQQRITQTNDHA